MYDVTNGDRAESALSALIDFIDGSKVDTARDAIADLICNLIHLARGRGLDHNLLVLQASRMAEEEAREDDNGPMDDVQERFREILPEDS